MDYIKVEETRVNNDCKVSKIICKSAETYKYIVTVYDCDLQKETETIYCNNEKELQEVYEQTISKYFNLLCNND